MKTKYQKLSKDEKKNIKKEFLATKKGGNVNHNLKRARICALLCIIYSLYLIIDYLLKKENISGLVSAFILLAFGIFSIIYSHIIFAKSINDYLISQN